jgi:hypothetical protein
MKRSFEIVSGKANNMRNLVKLSVTAGALALGALAPLSAAKAADMAPEYQPPPQAQYAAPPAYYAPPPAYYPPPPVAYYSYDVPAYYAQPYYYGRYWRGYGPRFAYGYGRGYGYGYGHGGHWHR